MGSPASWAAEAFDRYGVDGVMIGRGDPMAVRGFFSGDQALLNHRSADAAAFGARTGRIGEAAPE
ncbi:MAG: hypothetical protein ACLR8Y_00085 [Alistipes indistinctus]